MLTTQAFLSCLRCEQGKLECNQNSRAERNGGMSMDQYCLTSLTILQG